MIMKADHQACSAPGASGCSTFANMLVSLEALALCRMGKSQIRAAYGT
jgi:hypothetical protein